MHHAFVEYKGKLWQAMEDAMGEIKKWGKRYGTFMMSMEVDKDQCLLIVGNQQMCYIMTQPCFREILAHGLGAMPYNGARRKYREYFTCR